MHFISKTVPESYSKVQKSTLREDFTSFLFQNQTSKLCTTIVLFLLIRDPRNNTIVPLLNVSQGQIWLQILSIVINQAVIKKTFLHWVVGNRICWILTRWLQFWVNKLGTFNFFTQYSCELKALISLLDFPDMKKILKPLVHSKSN